MWWIAELAMNHWPVGWSPAADSGMSPAVLGFILGRSIAFWWTTSKDSHPEEAVGHSFGDLAICSFDGIVPEASVTPNLVDSVRLMCRVDIVGLSISFEPKIWSLSNQLRKRGALIHRIFPIIPNQSLYLCLCSLLFVKKHGRNIGWKMKRKRFESYFRE